jgi:O-antigen/teichoic acid export membrane protein
MTITRRILRNFAALALAEGFSRIFGLISTIYLARALGPQGFGLVGFAIALVSFFTLAVSFGLDTYGIREVARDKSQVRRYVGDVVAIRFILAIVAYCVLLGLSLLVIKGTELKGLLLILGFLFFTSALNVGWAFQGAEKMWVLSLGRILESCLYLLGLVLFVKGIDQIYLVPCFFVLASFIALLLISVLCVRTFGLPHIALNVERWRSVFRQAAPMGIAFLMIQVYQYIDTVMLGFMRSEAEVGFYVSAYKVMTVSSVPAGLILGAFFPLLSSKEGGQTPSLVTRYVKTMLIVGIPISVSGVLFAREIILLFYGPLYEQAVLPFTILMANPFLVYTNMAFGNPLLAWDKQRQFMVWIALGAILNVALNVVVIPIYGIVGAAITTVVTQFGVFWGMRHEFLKVVRVRLVDVMIRPVIWAAVMAGGMWVLRQILGPEYAVCVFLLGSTVYALGVLGSENVLSRSLSTLSRKG